MPDFRTLVERIQQGDVAGTQQLVNDLLDQGKVPGEIIHQGIVVALDRVGKKFSRGECFIPELLIAARASQKGLDLLKPLFVKTAFKTKGKVVIGTVKGDLHDIGKNIVSMMFEASGFEVRDLGADVFPETFTKAVRTLHPQIVALSCLLTTTMASMSQTIDNLQEAGLRDTVKVIIGGPPTNDDFAKKIGADFYGEDAYAGVEIARRIVSA